MSKQVYAEYVARYLGWAREAAIPLKDQDLVQKIEQAQKHIQERVDPKKS